MMTDSSFKEITDFSYDIEYQILSRITWLETLDRCKAVCKRWYKIINEVSFMPTYCRNTTNMFGYFLQEVPQTGRKNMFGYFLEEVPQTGRKNHQKAFASINPHDHNTFIPSFYTNLDLKLDDDDDGVEIIASSMQGIILCAKPTTNTLLRQQARHMEGNMFDRDLYVCKPTTAQWQGIPHPSLNWLTNMNALIVLSNKPLRYKIILVWEDSSKYWYEMFDSRRWKWSNKVELLLPTGATVVNQQGINIVRFSYFLIEKIIMGTFVMAFDGYVDETIEIPPIPESAISSSSSLDLKKAFEYQGKLGLIHMPSNRSSPMPLWILERHNHHDQKMTTCNWTWKKIKEIDMSFLGPSYTSHVLHPIGFYNADILVLKRFPKPHASPLISDIPDVSEDNDDNWLMFCNIQDRTTYKELKLNSAMDGGCQCFPFRSDREVVDLQFCVSLVAFVTGYIATLRY